MQKELDDISTQLALLDSDDNSSLSGLGLLTIPTRPTKAPPEPEEPTISRHRPERQPTKLPPLSSKVKPLPKAKESMQMRSNKLAPAVPPRTPKGPIFKAAPSELKVVNFALNTDYFLRFTLQNISTHTHGFQVRGPADPAFRFRSLDDTKTSEIRP
jgi:hypothetical protein